MQLLKRFPIASMPSHLDYAPDSSRVFVSLQGTDSLVAIDLNRLAILWNEKVGKTPAGVLWHDGKRAGGRHGHRLRRGGRSGGWPRG